MNFLEAIASGFRNYVNFSGRASRSEYWYWILFITILRFAGRMLDVTIFQVPFSFLTLHPFSAIIAVVIFLPALGLEIRRLHDVDRSGWWLLMYLTIIGILFPLLYWKLQKGTDGPNRFGADPLGMGYAVSVFE